MSNSIKSFTNEWINICHLNFLKLIINKFLFYLFFYLQKYIILFIKTFNIIYIKNKTLSTKYKFILNFYIYKYVKI